jgi:hypothetical protein
MVENQLMDPVALGGVPGYVTAGAHNSLRAGCDLNPFVCGFLAEMKAASKQMTTPYELDEDSARFSTSCSTNTLRYTTATS